MTRLRQQGFAYIAAVIILLVVAGVSLALLRMTGTQQNTVNQTLLGVRANQAARAGIDWMFYRLTHDGVPDGCPAGASANLTDFQPDSGFLVSVSCNSKSYKEGEAPDGTTLVKVIYQIEAVACNGSTASCPDNASVARPDYVERRRIATVCMTSTGADCY